MKKLIAMAALAAGLAFTPVQAQEDFPNRPITMVVAFSPGGSIDLLGRLVAEQMEKSLGVPVVVENVGGAGGIVGAETVAASDPDGYTMVLVSPGAISVAEALDREMSYEPTELTPIANLTSYVPVLLVTPQLPVDTVEELIAYGEENPGMLQYGASGVGSSTHVLGELFNSAAGLEMVPIQYQGGGAVMQGLVTGDNSIAITSLATVQAQIESGEVKPIAVFDTERYYTVPDVPAITETLPDFEPPVIWFGLFGPPGIPPEIARTLNEHALAALEEPSVAERLDALAYKVIGGTPEEFGEFVVHDIDLMEQALGNVE